MCFKSPFAWSRKATWNRTGSKLPVEQHDKSKHFTCIDLVLLCKTCSSALWGDSMRYWSQPLRRAFRWSTESMRHIWLLWSHRYIPGLLEFTRGSPWKAAKPRHSHWKSNRRRGGVHMKVFTGSYSVPHSFSLSFLLSFLRFLSSPGLCKLCGFGQLVAPSQ